MEIIEFYLNKIKKVIHLDDQQVVVLKQILDQFYVEATRSYSPTQIWMDGYKEGKQIKNDEGDD